MKKLLLILFFAPILGYGQVLTDVLYLEGHSFFPYEEDRQGSYSYQTSSGLNPFAVQGPMGRNVADTYLLLQAQVNLNRMDPFSSFDSISMPQELIGADLSNIKMAYSPDLGCAPVDNEIKSTFLNKMSTFKSNFKKSDQAEPDFLDVHNCFEVIRGFNYVASHKLMISLAFSRS